MSTSGSANNGAPRVPCRAAAPRFARSRDSVASPSMPPCRAVPRSPKAATWLTARTRRRLWPPLPSGPPPPPTACSAPLRSPTAFRFDTTARRRGDAVSPGKHEPRAPRPTRQAGRHRLLHRTQVVSRRAAKLAGVHFHGTTWCSAAPPRDVRVRRGPARSPPLCTLPPTCLNLCVLVYGTRRGFMLAEVP